ncbi:hypothetical protein V2P20_17790 [Methylobacter sp. Wu1]|uniref:hypothetical protein n=1 Tax=Methylobacter sp. Wu1 TaxID=3119359 RepID=UPI002F92EDB5
MNAQQRVKSWLLPIGVQRFVTTCLLNLASMEGLQFISEMVERFEAVDSDLENDACPFNPYQKVLINPEQLDQLIKDIDRLFLWCNDNISETTQVFRDEGYAEELIRKDMAQAADFTNYHYESDASCGPDFLFSALKAMQDIFRFAKDNNMPVTYENLAEC